MKAIFVLCTTLTILQVIDVSITGVSAVETKKQVITTQNQKQRPSTGTSNTTTRSLPRSTSNRQTQAAPKDDENTEQGQFVDGEEEPTAFMDAGKQLLSSVKQESGKRGAGVLNTVTGVLKASSGLAGLFGGLVRDQVKNTHRVASAKIDLLSGAGRGLTNGAVNVAKSAKDLGDQGGKVLSNTLNSATQLGKSAMRAGGAVIGGPVKMSNDGLNVIKRGANIGPKVTGTLSGAALNAMSAVGVVSDETEDEELEEAPAEKPPVARKSPTQPASKTTRTVSKS